MSNGAGRNLSSTQRLIVQQDGGSYRTLEIPAAEIWVGQGPSGLELRSQPGSGPVLRLESSEQGLIITPVSDAALINGEPVSGPQALGRYDLLEFAGALLRAESSLSDETEVESASESGTSDRFGRMPLDPSQPFAGRYRLEELLGRGGFGAVYRGVDQQLRRPVAIKVLVRAEGRALQRFAMEIRATAALQHPNLVTVYDSGIEGANPYLVMELVQGKTLDALAQGSLSPTRAAMIVRDVARALGYAHGKGLLHRDLKPQNILVRPDGTPVLLDFGLVRMLGEEGSRITRSGTRLGTAPYMSPEQAFAGEQDERSEVYGLGATLYHALSGQQPFFDADEILLAVVNAEPTPPSELRPGVPQDLESICLKCLEKRPRDRYPSAEALADDLDLFLEGRSTAARPLTLGEQLLRRVQRDRLTQVSLAAAASGFVALVAIAVQLGGSDPMPQPPEAPTEWVDRRAVDREGDAEDKLISRKLKANQALARRRLEELVAAPQATPPGQAVADLVRLGGEAARPELCAWLDALSEELLALERRVTLEANDGVSEGAALQGLEEAFEAYAALPLTSTLEPRQELLLSAARRRVRRKQADPESKAAPPTFLDLVAARQESALGSGRLRAAEVVCRALKGLGPGDGGLQALARYLKAEASSPRAAEAGAVLCRAGGKAVAPTLLAAHRRFGWDGPFARRLAPLLRAHIDEAPLPEPSAQAYLDRARYQGMAGNHQAALRDLNECLKLAPDLVDGFLARALCRMSLGDNPGALKDLDAAIDLLPIASELWSNRSNVKLQLGDLKGGVEDARQAIALDGGNALAHFNLGQGLLALGDRDGARRAYSVSLAHDPTYAPAWAERAELHMADGDPKNAYDDANRALSLDPNEATAHAVRSDWFVLQRKWNEALKSIDDAIRLNPRFAGYLVKRSQVHEALGDLQAAFDDLEQALRGASDAFLPDAITARARFHMRRGGASNRARAKNDLDWALKLAPNHAHALMTRANLSMFDQDADATLADLRALVRVDELNAKAWALLGETLLRSFDEEREGLEAVEHALSLDPKCSVAFLARGSHLARKGQFKEGLADLERYLELVPEGSAAVRAVMPLVERLREQVRQGGR